MIKIPSVSSDGASSISTSQMEMILERLKSQKNRNSTMNNYLAIWRNFNNFLIKLDRKPDSWEERVSLFGAYLVDKGRQSCTLKSYISAIKCILVDDGYLWDDNKVVLSTLVKACKIVNDRVRTRLPIQDSLLEIILFEIQRIFESQPYLEILYKAMLALGYYGMFRVGEIALGNHTVKAKDTYIATNKNKMMFILYSSKTHNKGAKPQKVKISERKLNQKELVRKSDRFFCPYKLTRTFMAVRKNIASDNEPLFIFSDSSPVLPKHLRDTLRIALERINLDPNLYNVGSLRIGRATDMVTVFDYSISETKAAGRWRSNTVFRYIRSFEF